MRASVESLGGGKSFFDTDTSCYIDAIDAGEARSSELCCSVGVEKCLAISVCKGCAIAGARKPARRVTRQSEAKEQGERIRRQSCKGPKGCEPRERAKGRRLNRSLPDE